MIEHQTLGELEAFIGEELKKLRLNKNLSQEVVAERAGISRRALQKLEAGDGSSLSTFVLVLRTLGRVTLLNNLAPIPTVNPLTLLKAGQRRQRATPKGRKAVRIG